MNNAADQIKRLLILILMILTLGIQTSWAQDSTAVEEPATEEATTEESEEEEAEEETTLKSRMALTGSQFADGTIKLDALLRAKVGGSWEKITQQKVSFFSVNDAAEETPIGDTITGADGIARLTVNVTGMPANADGSYYFLARFEGNDNLTGSESEVILQPAKLVMEASEEDSVYTIKLLATANSAEGPVPIAAAPVSIYVQRMFSSLKIAEGETDENGVFEVEFPSGLSGDQDANLAITARIEETEAYGNLEASMVRQWGKPVSYEIKELPHALWSDHPPVWMIVTFFVLMGTVWFHYMYIVYNLFRIKADKDHPAG